MARKHTIPKIPHAFFRWYCKADRYEEMHGDLEEFYYERLEEQGSVKARLFYWRDVIRCCQPYAWKKPKGPINSNVIMFKNYFKTSIRGMLRNPLSSFINIFGLAVAIGVCIVVYSMIEFTYSTDQHHENKHEVFLATFTSDRDGSSQRYGFVPAPLGAMMKEDLAQISKMARLETRSVVIKNGDNVFHEGMRFVDPEFLEMLTFPLEQGDELGLEDRNGIVLSHEMAIKYFGYQEPLGQEMLVKFSETRQKVFTVRGVAREFPDGHAISFNFLINFDNLEFAYPEFDLDDWSVFVDATLIQLSQASDIDAIKQSMSKYTALQNAKEHDWKVENFGFESIADLRNKSSQIANDISRDQADELLIGLPMMGLFILALACFNYMNMAIGSSTKRLKEIGVRKVIGANRTKVLIQFLAENIFVTGFALILGVILAITLFLPWFSNLANASLSLSVLNANLWVFLMIIVFTTGIVSGLYPALYVSRFQVVKIFKGTVQLGKKNPIMKTFLGLQMILAFTFITMAVMFKQNSDFQAQRPWGYNQSGTLYLEMTDTQSFDQLKTALSQNPNILGVSGSRHHIGKPSSKIRVELAGALMEVQAMKVDENYFDVYGITLKTGAIYQSTIANIHQLVVNEQFIENSQLVKPIGQFIRIDSVQYQIIGVVEDFHAVDFYSEIQPTIFLPAVKQEFRYLSMSVNEGAEVEVFDYLKKEWAALFPETPFQGGVQIDLWANFYDSLEIMKHFTRTVASVAVLLAALGLYGLVNLNVSGRIKEFSIRKVLGAGLKNLTFSIGKQYFVLMLIAMLVGMPVAYLLNIGLIKLMFAYPLPNAQWSVLFGLLILVLVMFAVIGTQIRRVSISSPSEGLRSE